MSSTSNYIYKESLKEFGNIKSCCNSYQDIYKTRLQTINKLNGMDINCEFIINKVKKNSKKNEYLIGIWIDSKKVWIKNDYHNMFNHREKLPKYSSEKINDFLLKFKNDILPNLKLDKVFGKFTLIGLDGKKNISEENVGIDIFGLEYSNCNECSVCYESTYTLTHCNHPLCIECWNKLKIQSCPMCRDDISPEDNDMEDDVDDESNISYHNEMILGNQVGIYEDDEDDEDDEDYVDDNTQLESEDEEENLINVNQENEDMEDTEDEDEDDDDEDDDDEDDDDDADADADADDDEGCA